jgi:hypothetical protein
MNAQAKAKVDWTTREKLTVESRWGGGIVESFEATSL